MSIYSGSASFLIDYFSNSSTNFVIPDYQREYSWEIENINQLFIDLNFGINILDKTVPVLTRKEKQSKFLGCIIQYERAPEPGSDFEVVSGINYIDRIHELIDGQQRTSTIALLLSELYFHFENIKKSLDLANFDEEKLYSFIEDTVQGEWLNKGFARQGASGSKPSQRPILIRKGYDKWTHNTLPHYHSPVVNYLYDVIVQIDKAQTDGTHLERPQHTDPSIEKIINAIRDRLDERYNDSIYVLESAYDQKELLEKLVTGWRRTDIVQYLNNNSHRKSTIAPIINQIGLAHYLLNYCAFTVISSPTEDAALDMFQSLNATGVQLTAIQILKPHISKDYKKFSLDFSTSSELKKYEEINSWFNEDGRSKDKKIKQFFLKFSLALSGDESPTTLSGQRSWIIMAYKEFTSGATDIGKTKKFIKLMHSFMLYLKNFVFIKRNELFNYTKAALDGQGNFSELKLFHYSLQLSKPLTGPSAISIMFLIDANHDIAHTLLARYYSEFQLTTTHFQANLAFYEFEKICMACVSFFILWRMSFAGKYPDKAYRDLFKDHLSIQSTPVLPSQIASNKLRKKLIRKAIDFKKNDPNFKWFTTIAKNTKYKPNTKKIIRFILIIASHKTVPNLATSSPSSYGLIDEDASGPDYLNPQKWVEENCSTIEHVVPQQMLDYNGTDVEYWDNTFITASEIIHSIGNLTLLSQRMNSAVPETTVEKKNYYFSLISPGHQGALTKNATKLLSSAPYQGHLVAIAFRLEKWIQDIDNGIPPQDSEFVWNHSFIKSRANNIMKLITKRLFEWFI